MENHVFWACTAKVDPQKELTVIPGTLQLSHYRTKSCMMTPDMWKKCGCLQSPSSTLEGCQALCLHSPGIHFHTSYPPPSKVFLVQNSMGIVTIHVFDDARKIQQDFSCELHTLLVSMRWTETIYLSRHSSKLFIAYPFVHLGGNIWLDEGYLQYTTAVAYGWPRNCLPFGD